MPEAMASSLLQALILRNVAIEEGQPGALKVTQGAALALNCAQSRE